MNQESGNSFNGSQKMPKSSSGSKLPEKSKNNAGNDENGDYDYVVREQDRFMPIANVIRIMRRILPTHAKISDDAKETIQECVSEFISFVTSEANDRCQHEQRKTITTEDVLWSMGKLGFDDYIDPLTLYLHRYREFEGERGSMRVEPMMKRPQEMGPPMGGAPFPGAFQMVHHQGMYGPPMPGYGPNMNPNQGPMPGFDPFAPYK